jgi:hypothetical protein
MFSRLCTLKLVLAIWPFQQSADWRPMGRKHTTFFRLYISSVITTSPFYARWQLFPVSKTPSSSKWSHRSFRQRNGFAQAIT